MPRATIRHGPAPGPQTAVHQTGNQVLTIDPDLSAQWRSWPQCSNPGHEDAVVSTVGRGVGPYHDEGTTPLPDLGGKFFDQGKKRTQYPARGVEEVMERWPAFAKLHHVRSLETGQTVLINNGAEVVPNEAYYDDSFEATMDSGNVQRFGYRRVILPGERLPHEISPVVDDDDEVEDEGSDAEHLEEVESAA